MTGKKVMKKAGYLLFAWVYNLFCLACRVRERKIVLWNGHDRGLSGNLREIYRAMKEKERGYHFVVLAKRDLFGDPESGRSRSGPGTIRGAFLFFVILPFHMATAEKVFFNDNFLPLGYMRTQARKTQFVQLWHGAGAFKRFGLSTERDPKVYETVRRANQKITHLFVTSRRVIPYYQEAFAIPSDRIYATGIPVTDLYFDRERQRRRREAFYQRYPELASKKLLLYVPTFRGTERENRQILQQFDISRVLGALGEDWAVLIRSHPRFPSGDIRQDGSCYDMTHYKDISDLYLVADLLITDYSSAVIEYVLLDKPVVLFAYDLDRYDRGFYCDYEKMAPGKIVRSREELLALLGQKWEDRSKRQEFARFQYDDISGGSCDRILEILG